MSVYGTFMAFSRWCLNSPAVPEEKLRQLRVGMSQEEVVRLLGKPDQENRRRDRAEWRYGHRLKHHRLCLHFDKQARLSHFKHLARVASTRHD